jgi:hypothetical protein
MRQKASPRGEVCHGRIGPSKINVRSAQAVTDFPLTEEERVQIRTRLHELELEHFDLDDVIARLARDPAQDRIQLQRLKKRKLILKDQIQRLRARLIPDIIA